MGYFSSKRPAGLMYAVALAGLVLTVGATKVIGFDVWWHITTGWVIAHFHQIPQTDIFSYTAFGAPWVNHEWLFELIQWFIFDAGGIRALTAFKLALVASMSWLLFRTITISTGSRILALWGTAIFLWGASYRIMDRPFLMGMFFLAFFSFALHKHCSRGTWLIWLLPPLQIIWINSHGGGLLGVELTMAFAAGEALQAFASKRLGGEPPISAGRRRKLWTVALLCTLASFANPWGADIFIFFREHAQMQNILAYTQEWLPLLSPHLDGLIPPTIYTIVLFGTLASFIVNAKRTRVAHLFATALTAAMLYMAHRFGPEFLIVNMPIMLHNFGSAFKRATDKPATNFKAAWINLTAVFILSVTTIMHGLPIHIDGKLLNDMGIGTEARYAPARMVDFLEYHGIGGRVLNEMGLGSYLIFRRWPKELVFIDGRTPVYGDAFYNVFVDAMRHSRNFEEFDKRYEFDYLVFSGFNAWKKREMHKHLWENPIWILVYAGNDGFVYLRRDGKNDALIKHLALEKHPVVEHMEKEKAKRERDESK